MNDHDPDQPMPPVVRRLAEQAVRLRKAPPPGEQVARQVERAVVDWFGAAIGGSRSLPAEALALGLDCGEGPSRLVGRATSTSPALAALINGTAAHALEVDDIYAPGLFHPGAPVIAAALATADRVGATGEDFLRAVLVGYEVGCRVAADLGPRHYAHWHTTGTAGTLGAAAAVADLLDLDEVPFAHALALAATMSAGLQQTFRQDAMGKPLHSGHAAQAGLVAAISAQRGVTGAPDALEGPAGLGVATGAPSDWSRSSAPWTGSFAVEQITVKPYPCCGHTFAPIGAAIALHQQAVRPDQVTRLRVGTYGTAIEVAGIREPATVAERRFSIPFVVATALVHGRVTDGHFTGAVDPAVNALMPRIELGPDPDAEREFPARRGANVEADVDGSVIRVAMPDRPGSPENPLDDEAFEVKFLDTVQPVLGERADAVLAGIRGLRGRRLDQVSFH